MSEYSLASSVQRWRQSRCQQRTGGEEEVHGGVEVGVRADGQDDEQVPQHGNQEHGQEHSTEKGLQFWAI